MGVELPIIWAYATYRAIEKVLADLGLEFRMHGLRHIRTRTHVFSMDGVRLQSQNIAKAANIVVKMTDTMIAFVKSKVAGS